MCGPIITWLGFYKIITIFACPITLMWWWRASVKENIIIICLTYELLTKTNGIDAKICVLWKFERIFIKKKSQPSGLWLPSTWSLHWDDKPATKQTFHLCSFTSLIHWLLGNVIFKTNVYEYRFRIGSKTHLGVFINLCLLSNIWLCIWVLWPYSMSSEQCYVI